MFAMFTLKELSITGIRSFNPKKPNTIKFNSPLTLITGVNGSGKTTIIEVLKFLTTGDLPPNSKSGAFVHDPKLSGTLDNCASLSLRYSILGDKQETNEYEVTKRVQASYKRNKSNADLQVVEQRTQDISLVKQTKEGRMLISNRITDIDRIIPIQFSSNSSLLQSVIFCHQEESTWPSSEPSNFKKKIDDIFSSSIYIKAIQELKITRREMNTEVKLKTSALAFLQKEKNKRDDIINSIQEKAENIESKEHECKRLRQSLDSSESKLQNISKRLSVLNQLNDNYVRLSEDLSRHKEFVKEAKESDICNKICFLIDEINKISLLETPGVVEEQIDVSRVIENIRKLEEISEKTVCDQEIETEFNLLENSRRQIIKSQEEYNRKLETIKLTQESLDIVQYELSTTEDIALLKKEYQAEKNRSSKAINELFLRREKLMQEKEKYHLLVNQLSLFVDENNEIFNFHLPLLKENLVKRVKKSAQATTIFTSVKKEIKQIIDSLQLEKARLTDSSIQSAEKDIEKNNMKIQSNNSRINELMKSLQTAYKTDGIRKNVLQLKKRREEIKTELSCVNQTSDGLADIEEIKKEIQKTELTINAYENARTEIIRKESISCVTEKENRVKITDLIHHVHVELVERYDDIYKQTIYFLNKTGTCSQNSVTDNSIVIDAVLEKRFMDYISTFCNAEEREICLMFFDVIYKIGKNGLLSKTDLPNMETLIEQWKTIKSEIIRQKGQLDIYNYLENNTNKKCGLCRNPLNKEEECLVHQSIKISNGNILKQIDVYEREIEDLKEKIAVIEKESKIILSTNENIDCLNNIVLKFQQIVLSEMWNLKIDIHDAFEGKQTVNIDEIPLYKNKIIDNINKNKQKVYLLNENIRRYKTVNEEIFRINQSVERLENSVNSEDSICSEEISKELNNLLSINKELQDETKRCSDNLLNTKIANERLEKLNNACQLADELEKISGEKIDDLLEKLEAEIEATNNSDRFASLEKRLREYEALKINEDNFKNKITEETEKIKELKNLDYIKINRFIELVSDNIKLENQFSNLMKIVTINESDGAIYVNRITEETRFDLIRCVYSAQREYGVKVSKCISYYHQYKAAADVFNKFKKCEKIIRKIKAELETYSFDEREIFEKQESELKCYICECEKLQGIYEGEIKQLRLARTQLEKDLVKYCNAREDYNKCLLEIKYLEYALNDIEKSIQALDISIVEYQSNKIAEVNASLKDLWNETYQGNDIDYIEIQCENIYKVMMIKDDVAMDMRGRSSAGQKMLASILIRISLADAFSVNGVLALDEPTTNLDSKNIEALGNSLNNIISSRKSLQLIIITHDEDFVSILNRIGLDCCYRIEKHGCVSNISKQNSF